MYCTCCGNTLIAGQKFCGKCGNKNLFQPEQFPVLGHNPYTAPDAYRYGGRVLTGQPVTPAEKIGMVWHTVFQVLIGIGTGARIQKCLFTALIIILLFSGGEGLGDTPPEEVADIMKAIRIEAAEIIVTLAFIVFRIIFIVRLKKRKKNIYIPFIVFYAFYLVEFILNHSFLTLIENHMMPDDIAGLAESSISLYLYMGIVVASVVVNYIYYKKRQHMFVN